MARQEFSGSAVPAKLAGSITDSDNSISITDATGWPTGTHPFVVTIGRGTPAEETILCSGRVGTTLSVSTRGYDGTAAAAHAAGDDIEHTISAAVFEDLSDHVYNTGRDNHTQYLNGTRHDARDHTVALASAAIGDLGDVDNTAPDGGDVLTWDDGDDEWKPQALVLPAPVQAGQGLILSTGGSTITFPESFDDLPVVVVTPVSSGSIRLPILGSITTTGFSCALVDNDNNAVTGSIWWMAAARTDV